MIQYIAFGAIALVAVMRGQNMNETKEKVTSWNRWDTLIKTESVKYGVDWQVVKAIMIIESDLGRAPSVAYGMKNPEDAEKSKSSDGKSWGLMQLTLNTARMFESMVTVKGLNDPETSVRIACKYIAWLQKKNPSHEFIARGYNGGAGWANSGIIAQGMTKVYFEKFKLALVKVKSIL